MTGIFRKKGFSLIELLVAIVILSFLAGFFQMLMRWNKKTMETLEKTDMIARLRNSSLIISRFLSFSTEFLYPGKITTAFSNQIIFRDVNNNIGAIFLNKNKELSYYNYSTGESRDITPFTVSFKSRLVKQNLMEYKVEIQKDEYKFFVSNQQSTCNTLP